MAKLCKQCGKWPVFSGGLCKYCKPRTPLKKASKRIKPASTKLVDNRKLYRPLRDKFLEDNPECKCKLPGCTGVAAEVHHKKGRDGKWLCIVKYFLAVCHPCHDIIGEMSIEEAVERGFSIRRNGPLDEI